MIQPSPYSGKEDGAEEMRPDVNEIVMDVEDRGEGPPVAVAVRTVSRDDVMVIAPPGRQVVPQHKQRRGDLLLYVPGGLYEACAALPEAGVRMCVSHDMLGRNGNPGFVPFIVSVRTDL